MSQSLHSLSLQSSRDHEFGLQENPSYIFHTEPHNMHQSYEITYQCLKTHPEIDAIFAATDILALGAVNAIKDFGKKIPQEIAVIGFSNWFVTQYLRPKLSTVAQPSATMGQKATTMLIDEIEKTDKHIPFEHQIIQLPTQLILRDSTKNT